MASVSVSGLRKEFDNGQIVAVEDVDIDIDDGEFITVVGPSGCGKSTTLRMLAGLESPTDGSIHIGSDDVTDVHAKNRDVAMVFQNYALYPHKTVAENMGFGLRMSTDMSKSERRDTVEEAAEMMGIDDLLEDKPDELSGGQQQRVALGRAIVRDPDVFLFDEPLSNLDAKLRKEMRTEIQRLQNELDVTTVYVTHDQEEAMTMGDRIVILKDGIIQQIGKPTEVYDNPVNEFVGGFIGSPSMNFVDVTLETDGDDAALVDDEGVNHSLSPAFLERLRDNSDAESFRLGIRPEDLFPADGDGDITATLEVIEELGSDNFLYLDIGDDFIARVDSSFAPDLGDSVDLTFEETDIHLFEADTGESVFTADDRRAATPTL